MLQTHARRGARSLEMMATAQDLAKMQFGRIGTRAGYVIIIESFVIWAIAVLHGSRVWLVHHLQDDAYYYFEIGHRIATGQGPSFDGITQTDGFHPLWQLLVAGLSVFWRGDELIRAALLVSLGFGLIALLLLVWTGREAIGAGPAIFGGLIVVHSPQTFDQFVNGMESSAVVVMLAIVIVAYVRADERRTPHWAAALGLASGLLVLARLDFGAVIPLVGLALLYRTRSPRMAVAWAIPTAIVAGSFFVWNLFTFHHLNTVSGTIKLREMNVYFSDAYGGRATLGYVRFTLHTATSGIRTLEGDTFWSALLLQSNFFLNLLAHAIPVVALCGLIAMVARRVVYQVPQTPVSSAQFALVLGGAVVGAKGLLDVLALPLNFVSWYSAPERVGLGFGAGLLAWRALTMLRGRWKLIARAVMVFLVFLSLPISWYVVVEASSTKIVPTSWQDASLQASSWVDLHGPSGRYGSTDAGLLGFYIDGPRRTVVNLDGLVNNFWYEQYLFGEKFPLLTAYKQLKLRYYLGRAQLGQGMLPKCASVVWRYPYATRYWSGDPGVPVEWRGYGVWDLAPCYRR